MRLLVVDDEPRLTAALARGLGADGFAVDVAADGETALRLAATVGYDAMLLDLMMPKVSGYDVLRRLRAQEDWTPVLVLSAKDGEFDLADALDLGADDYLVKPYSYVVLLARLRALLRRGRDARPAVLTGGGVVLDPATREVTVDGAAVDLTPREFSLLEYLLSRVGAAVSKSELLEHVFDVGADGGPNLVEVYVGYLRRKLGRAVIVTVRGGGYRIPTA
ncbi:MAG: putative two-component system response regulator [Frankiales bacterium]|nr:putative two-component system response regulator [Frankiales bacterium]